MRHLTDQQAAFVLHETFPDRQYELGEYLGGGGQGSVWALKGANQLAVCKMLPLDPSAEMELDGDGAARYRAIMRCNASRELEHLKKFSSSRYFPTLLDARVYMPENASKTGQVYIFIEEQLLPLERASTEMGLSAQELAIRVGYTISCAIQFLEANHCEYRDIKQPNLLIRENNDNTFEVVLADLGASKEMVPGQVDTVIGSPGHLPPERLRKKMCVPGKGDVYSLGVTVLEIFTGKYLYIADEAELNCAINQCLSLVKNQNKALHALLQKMLRENPFLRISATQAAKAFQKMLPTTDPEQLRSTARRALSALQRGGGALNDAKRLAERLPTSDSRRYLLLALITSESDERFKNLRYASRLGSPSACYYLGIALLIGEYLPCDTPLAISYLTCAAKACYMPAIHLLQSLRTGETIREDSPTTRIAYLMKEISA